MMDGGAKSAIHNYLDKTCLLMKNYHLPQGIVKMSQDDTIAVVCLLLYFINETPSISKTKLAYQIMLLDNMLIIGGGQVPLMQWQANMKNGIPNLEPFLSFMENQKLILKKNKGFYLADKNIISRFDATFRPDLIEWLGKINALLHNETATSTAKIVKYCIANRRLP